MYPALTRQPLACVVHALGLVVPGLAPGRTAGQAQIALTVERPVGRVFPFFARYASWPRFMRHLYEVEEIGFGLSRWKAAGPAGLPVGWTARVTRYVPNELIAWQSQAGSAVAIDGSIRFEPLGAQQTRVLVRLYYQLPAGRLGQFVAWLFAADPESILDEELTRVKQLIETEEDEQ
jgi:uncharacterized membrane protein